MTAPEEETPTPKNPPDNMPRISADLLYEDVGGALDWLAKAFGFRERMRMPGKDGKIMHAEMELADEVIMMGNPGADYRNPKRVGHVTQHLYVYVDDVDAHCEHVRDAGATILAKPESQFYGDSRYGAENPEGHQWYYAQHERGVAPENMMPPAVRAGSRVCCAVSMAYPACTVLRLGTFAVNQPCPPASR